MHCYQLKIFSCTKRLRKIVKELTTQQIIVDGVVNIDLENHEIFIRSESSIEKYSLPKELHSSVKVALEIDWEQQWKEHCPYYTNGIVKLPLIELFPDAHWKKGEIELIAGGGFGDFSHPTTILSLKLLSKVIEPITTVIDIGTGSGILSLAAAALGAQKVIGIDIDPIACQHCITNIMQNGLEDIVSAYTWDSLPLTMELDNPLFVMNMLPHEQEQAYSCIPREWLQKSKTWIVSGILQEYLESYKEKFINQKCCILAEENLDGWASLYISSHVS